MIGIRVANDPNPVPGGLLRALSHALTRIVVLPFRSLRPDPDTEFLAFSLPDAIATSLSGNSSVVVRSTAKAARFAGDAPDLKMLATDADVDRVVMGTLLRSGDQVRATAQLVEAPGGTLITTHTVQSSMGDLFRLQDDIARSVVNALSLPLGGGVASPAPDAPQNPQAYELYLRANELARTYEGMTRARELYRQCLELDPRFAPAWALLGRCHRVLGEYVDGAPVSEVRAQEAFNRALELNPRLSMAHKFLAQLEAEVGHAERALVRLLGEASRHGNDPELFAGLVHVCRYCGLFDESIAAHFEAREALIEMRKRQHVPAFRMWTDYLMAWLEYRPRDMVLRSADLPALKILEDPEAMFTEGWLLCDAGDFDRGVECLGQAVARGYAAAPTLRRARQFDPVRSSPEFQRLLSNAEAARAAALHAFKEAGGTRLPGALAAQA